jgi:hypothetical protein
MPAAAGVLLGSAASVNWAWLLLQLTGERSSVE